MKYTLSKTQIEIKWNYIYDDVHRLCERWHIYPTRNSHYKLYKTITDMILRHYLAQAKRDGDIEYSKADLVFFKRDLLEYMEESKTGFKNGMDQLHKIQSIWHHLLSHFCRKFCDIDKAPVLSPDISDPDGKELYDDLCAVADKWINIYNERLKEL